ncbi:MAG TPA: hypothetical protein VF263_16460 [Longimicrobiaceae bacterium]
MDRSPKETGSGEGERRGMLGSGAFRPPATPPSARLYLPLVVLALVGCGFLALAGRMRA